MEPSKILYYNKATKVCELFNRENMKDGKSIKIYNREYTTSRIINHIVLDGEADFTTKTQLGKLSGNIMYTLWMCSFFTADTWTDIHLHVQRIRMDDEFVVELTEKVDTSNAFPIGKITLMKNVKKPIMGHSCRAAVIVDPGKMGNSRLSTFLGDNALGALATSMGTYLLAMCDGQWEKIGDGWKDTYTDNSEKVKAFQKKNFELEEQNKTLHQTVNAISGERDAANELIEEAKAAESEASEKISRLQKENANLQEQYNLSEQEKKKAAEIAEQKIEKRAKELVNIWKIYLCGPNHKHQVKFSQGFAKQVAKAHPDIQSAVQRKMVEIVNMQNLAAVLGNRGKMHTKDGRYHCKIQKSKGDRLHYTFDPKENCVTFVDFIPHDKQDKMI